MSINYWHKIQRWQWLVLLATILVVFMFILVDSQGPRLRRVEYIPAENSGDVVRWRLYFNQPVKDPSPENISLSSGSLHKVVATNDMITIQVYKNDLKPAEQQIDIVDLQSKYSNRKSNITYASRRSEALFYDSRD